MISVIEMSCLNVPSVLGVSLIAAIKRVHNQVIIVGVLVYFCC